MAVSSHKIQKVCEYCGNTFLAQKATTRYCSHVCNSRDYKKNKKEAILMQIEEETQKEIEERIIQPLREKEIFNVAEAALFLGVSRQTVYNMIHAGVIKAAQITERLSLIRKKDIEAIFDNAEPYKARPARTRIPISEVYTVAEIKEKYKVNESWVFIVAKKHNFPRILKRGKTYFSRKHVDAYFAQKAPNLQITEWYSVDEIKEKYNMTTNAVYTFVSENTIPKKKEGRSVYYSKTDVDRLKGFVNQVEPEYYTVQEAMEKYNITRDQLYHYVKYHKIPKMKIGKFIKIERASFDKVLNPIIT
jgi:excisionase family DNA binding protein